MKFRKQLVSRMFNRICYTFRLKTVTELNGHPKPLDVDELVIKFYRGLMPNHLRPKFVYLKHLRYNGYCGHIFVGHKEIQITRNDRHGPFKVRPMHSGPVSMIANAVDKDTVARIFNDGTFGIRGKLVKSCDTVTMDIETYPTLLHRSTGTVTIRGELYAIAPYFRHHPGTI